ncbi:MAG TPA: hypothetical protein VJN18_32210 [Polyangiaceae bacterium]|nr:hypothetical protein [Polyangiaceae bacterium]
MPRPKAAAKMPSARLYELAEERRVPNPAMFTATDVATVLDEMEERWAERLREAEERMVNRILSRGRRA